MEATGSYGRPFAHYLYNNQHDVHIVNSLCINAFAKSKLSRHKTDQVDSKLIAEFIQQNNLPLYSPRETELQTLQDLYRCLQNLKHQAKQVGNYLKNKKHLTDSVCKSYARLTKSISKEMITIEEEINILIENTKDIKNKVTHMQTIPGIGKLTAVAILAESTCLDNFTNAREFAAYAGLTPKHKTSGTSVKGRSTISKMRSSTLRKALYFSAIVAKKHNPIFVKLNQKLASKGKPTKLILMATSRILCI
jgi:transposase